jgi:phage FluMu protein Com
MRTCRGNVIPNGEGFSVIVPSTDVPAFKGGGDINWVCGHCGHLVAQAMLPGQIKDIVIKCFSCASLNGIGPDLERDPSSN